MNSNANEGGEATPEQILAEKLERSNRQKYMEERLPYLRVEKEYFELQALTEEAILRRQRAQKMLVEMTPPKASDKK